jgi:hypothetical protein
MVAEPYFRSMLKLCALFHERHIPLKVFTLPGDSLVSRARNTCVAKFLATGSCTHLLFIDADIEFPPECVPRMLQLDKDVLCAVCPKKAYHFDRVEHALRDGLKLPEALIDFAINLDSEAQREGEVAIENGCVPVRDGGAGMMMIRRHVFQQMIQAWPQLRYRDNMLEDASVTEFYALFDPIIDPQTQIYLSEDYAFCCRWRQLGGQIWADVSLRLGHMGTHLYSGSPMDYHFTAW